MEKVAFFSIAFLLLVDSGPAQTGWQWQNPLPQGNALYSLSIVVNEGWAVGPLGTAVHTSDAGASWEKVDLGTTENLNCVFMHSETQIFVVGDNGLILYLYYDGANLDVTQQDGGTTEDLRSITSHTNGCLWIAGENGTVLRSTDMGRTWNKQNVRYDNNLYSIHNIECTTAWAVGLDGFIMHTTDWGITWTRQYPPATGHLLAVNIGTFEHVRAVGNSGTILITTDGGNNWVAEESGTDSHLNDILNVGYSRAYAVGTEGTILETTDVGEPWIQRKSGTNTTLYDVEDQWGTDNMWVVGHYGLILKNSGIGTDFQIQNVGTRLFIESVEFTSKDTGWAAGGDLTEAGTHNGIILRTTDGGTSWTERRVDTLLNAVDFIDGSHGWAVGQHGMVLRTMNGVNWHRQTSPITSNLNALCFIDEYNGWAVGDYGEIIHTTNRGVDWTRQSSPTQSWLYGVHFANETNGWAVGEFSTILYTTNGGETWLEQDANASQNFRLTSVYFIDKSHGWVSSAYGRIFLTTDGGDNWQQLETPGLESLMSIRFTDNYNGWAVGGGGTILRSRDGGRTWKDQFSGVASNTLMSVCMIDTNTGWIVGEGGTILHTTNGGSLVGVREEETRDALPDRCSLSQNYPNPFNPVTSIRFVVRSSGFVELKVYDVLGREAITLVNEKKNPGSYEVKFDASNLPSGVYFYRITANGYTAVKKMAVIK